MNRTVAIASDGHLFELEGDRTIGIINTSGQVNQLIEALELTEADSFVVLPIGEEPPVPRGDRISKRKISQVGIDLIKSFEGFEAEAYQCPAGKWTIGYGHTKTAKSGMTITPAQAEQLLKEDLNRFEVAVEDLVKVSINDNQFAALVSFAFNLGARRLKESTLLQRLNSGDSQQAANEFLRWNKAGGQVLKGLTFRRQAERALFLGEDWRPFRNGSD